MDKKKNSRPSSKIISGTSAGKKSSASVGSKKKQYGGAEELRKRMKYLAGFMICCYLVVCVALAWYQIINRDEWRRKAIDQQLYDVEIAAQRGTIYDSNMDPLVQSVSAWVVKLNTYDIKEDQKDAIVAKLSEVLELSEEYIQGRMKIKAVEVSLKQKANKEQKDAIDAFIYDEKGKRVIYGVSTELDSRRTYSRGTLLSTVLGFTGSENYGLDGLELQYETELAGINGRTISAKNAVNSEMPYDYSTKVDPQDGNSIVLSIDATIQGIVEKYLAQAVEENDIRNRACGIMMDVNTGAVLAMATMPDYDPYEYLTIADEKTAAYIASLPENEQSEATTIARQQQWRNKAISDYYEPGSVFKPITMSAALEEGVTSLSDSFYCKGYVMFGRRSIKCHKSGGHGAESLSKGMMNSCNPVFMALGERLGGSGFFKYYKAFGFTEKTGIDLPGESLPVAGVHYHTESSLNKHAADLAVSSFGQTNTVTPIQMITAISAVCNGGYLLEPYVVAQILDSEGNIISTTETTVKRQVISSQTSDYINSMLESTVSEGTAKNGYIAGYRIGGKTGTSEKIAEAAQTGEKTYVASFCAIAPSDDPQIALLIILDDPRGANHMGGTIAAPVARNILNEVLPYLGVETIYSSDDVKTLDTIAPNLKGQSVSDAKAALDAKDLDIRVIGSGDTVTGQIPQAGQSIPKGGTVVVTTNESGEVPMTTVPNVTGMTPAEANRALTNAHLNIRYSGSGYDTTRGVALSQSIPKDSKVAEGTVVTVEFIMSGSTD